jgi:hypothetical protein
MAASARGEPDGRHLRALALLTGVAVVITAYSPVVPGAFAGLALSGFFSIWLIAAANTLVQLRAGPALRGRVMGIWTMALPGSYPGERAARRAGVRGQPASRVLAVRRGHGGRGPGHRGRPGHQDQRERRPVRSILD